MARRVYFSVSGIGFGHVSRCLEAARELRRRGWEVVFSTFSEAVTLAAQEGFPTVSSPPLKIWTWPDGAVDVWRSLRWYGALSPKLLLEQTAFELREIASFKPNLVVSDSRLAPIIAARMAGRSVVTVLNQFYVISPGMTRHPLLSFVAGSFTRALIVPIWAQSDLILVPDLPLPNAISGRNMIIPKGVVGKVRFIGPMIPVRPETLPDAKQIREKLGLDDRPLIYAPLSGPPPEKRWLGAKLLEYLRELPSQYQSVVSLGRPEGGREPRRLGGLTIYNWIPSRWEMLKAADVVIGRGGHTTILQAITYGKPLLLIPTQEQTEQIGNVKRAVALGVALGIDPRRLSKETLRTKIVSLLETATQRRESAEMLRGMASKMDGLKKLVEIIESYGG